MLSVIVETADAGDRLPALLSALTSAAVDGLVREVLIAGGGPPELLAVLREETGAELADDLAAGERAVDERLDLGQPRGPAPQYASQTLQVGMR